MKVFTHLEMLPLIHHYLNADSYAWHVDERPSDISALTCIRPLQSTARILHKPSQQLLVVSR